MSVHFFFFRFSDIYPLHRRHSPRIGNFLSSRTRGSPLACRHLNCTANKRDRGQSVLNFTIIHGLEESWPTRAKCPCLNHHYRHGLRRRICLTVAFYSTCLERERSGIILQAIVKFEAGVWNSSFKFVGWFQLFSVCKHSMNSLSGKI